MFNNVGEVISNAFETVNQFTTTISALRNEIINLSNLLNGANEELNTARTRIAELEKTLSENKQDDES